MPDMTAVTSSPFCSSSFKSSPKILSASAPLVPVIVSPTLSSMGCEKFQIAPGYFSTRAVHGGDQFLFVLMKYRAPLVVRLQVDEILGVAESPGVGSVVGPADLRHDRFHLRERGENIAARCW